MKKNNTIWIIETRYKYGNDPFQFIVDENHFSTRKLARQYISNSRKELRESMPNLNKDGYKGLNQLVKYRVVKFVRG